MSNNELKAALAFVSAMSLSLMAQADQSMNDQMESSYVPGEIVKTGQLPAGYNASATYQCARGWDVFVTGNYVYWAWQQDSFQLGTLDPNVSTNFVGSFGDREDVFQNPGYASGFQVGLGFNIPGMDDWNLYAEYTWYKNSDSTSVSTTPNRVLRLAQAALIVQEANTLGNLNGTLSSNIEMKFDALDFLAKRPFYFGRKLTANFAAGLKALWITQDFDTSMVGLIGPNLNVSINRSATLGQTGWGLGPKFGFETNWLLGYGLQVMANLSTSVLYNQYNMNGTGQATIAGTAVTFSRQLLDNYGTLRPVTEAFLGLGWGMGFSDDRWRLALSAGYDFDVYWNYNMLFYTSNQVTGNMYLQGLNVGARFDF